MKNSTNTAFQARQTALLGRVAFAARELQGQGIRPTVARLRAALGGGSPNEIAPALKQWRDTHRTGLGVGGGDASTRTVPAPIADLLREFWTRAVAAATVDRRSGDLALAHVAKSEEVVLLRRQIAALHEQADRDATAYGELRALSARHDAIARDALARLQRAEARQRQALAQFGAARLRIAELEAAVRLPTVKAKPVSARKKSARATSGLRTKAPSKVASTPATTGYKARSLTSKKSAVARRRVNTAR